MTLGASAVTLRELDAGAGSAAQLRRFHEGIYTEAFNDANERESLANMRKQMALARSSGGAYAYHVVLAYRDSELVGGIVFDYLRRSNAGVIEFLVVSASARGQGIAGCLLGRCEQLLQRAARSAGHAQPLVVLAEMNDPEKVPAATDVMSPAQRLTIWARWGFERLDFQYVQPALSERKHPVECLLLAAKQLRGKHRASVGSRRLVEILRDYLRHAFGIAEPSRNREFVAMRRRLLGRRRVPLVALDRVADGSIRVEPLRVAGDPRVSIAANLVAEGIPEREWQIPVEAFRTAIRRATSGRFDYVLWLLRAEGEEVATGMASFFVFRRYGFCGYLIVPGALRGQGQLRALVQRIEQEMRRLRPAVTGWFAECGPATLPVFMRVGFLPATASYDPDGKRRARGDMHPPLSLLYKRISGPRKLRSEDLAEAIGAITRHVYG